jgi:integrase/recombinase XerD
MTTSLRQRMLEDLQIAGLSERTQEACLRAVRQLADHFRTPPDRLTEQQVRDYFLHLKNERKIEIY